MLWASLDACWSGSESEPLCCPFQDQALQISTQALYTHKHITSVSVCIVNACHEPVLLFFGVQKGMSCYIVLLQSRSPQDHCISQPYWISSTCSHMLELPELALLSADTSAAPLPASVVPLSASVAPSSASAAPSSANAAPLSASIAPLSASAAALPASAALLPASVAPLSASAAASSATVAPLSQLLRVLILPSQLLKPSSEFCSYTCWKASTDTGSIYRAKLCTRYISRALLDTSVQPSSAPCQ